MSVWLSYATLKFVYDIGSRGPAPAESLLVVVAAIFNRRKSLFVVVADAAVVVARNIISWENFENIFWHVRDVIIQIFDHSINKNFASIFSIYGKSFSTEASDTLSVENS